MLSSVQAVQQTSRPAANKHSPPLQEGVFLMVESTFFCEHMSSQQVKRGEVLHSEATEASADGGLGCVQSHSTWRTVQLGGLRKCARDKTKMTISGWKETNETAPSAAEGTGGAWWGSSSQTAPDCQMTFSKPPERNKDKAGKRGKINPSNQIAFLRTEACSM